MPGTTCFVSVGKHLLPDLSDQTNSEVHCLLNNPPTRQFSGAKQLSISVRVLAHRATGALAICVERARTGLVEPEMSGLHVA